jgi:hypothetical protein
MFFCVTDDLCEGGELYNYLVFGLDVVRIAGHFLKDSGPGNGIKKMTEPIARFFFKQVWLHV